MSNSSKKSNLSNKDEFNLNVTSSQSKMINDSDNKDDPTLLIDTQSQSQATTTQSATIDDIKAVDIGDTADTTMDDIWDIDDWSHMSMRMELLGDFVEYLDKGFDYFEVLQMAAKANQAKAAKAKEEYEKRLIYASGGGDTPCTHEISTLKRKYGMGCCCATCDPDSLINKYGPIDARRAYNQAECEAEWRYINEIERKEYNISYSGPSQDLDNFIAAVRNEEIFDRFAAVRYKRLVKLAEQDASKKNGDGVSKCPHWCTCNDCQIGPNWVEEMVCFDQTHQTEQTQ